MHKPVAGPFLGSVVTEDIPNLRTAQISERLLGVFCVVIAIAVGLSAYRASSGSSVYSALSSAMLALLVTAIASLFTIHFIENARLVTVARIYTDAFRCLSQTDRRAVADLPTQGLYSGIADLIGHLALRGSKIVNALACEKQEAAVLSRTLEQGCRQAQKVASQIRLTAGSLAETAAEIEFNGDLVAREMMSAGQYLVLSDAGMDRATAKLEGLSDSVRIITTNVTHMTSMAVDLSQLAHIAHQRIAQSNDVTSVVSAFDRIGHALQMAVSLVQSIGVEKATLQVGDVQAIAAELQALAGNCGPALDGASTFIRQLITEVSEANRRAIEVSNLILTNREITEALQNDVQQQGIAVAQVLDDIYQAREGFIALKAGLDRVTRSAVNEQSLAERLRSTANQLPGKMESIAGLLRNAPNSATFQHPDRHAHQPSPA